MSVRFAGADGIELVGNVRGRWGGPVVVFLHGGGQTRHAWGTTAGVLGDAGYLTFSMDGRGHGHSGWAPDGNYTIDRYADDLRAVVAQIGEPVALVGASLGGITSLVAVGEEPAVDATAVVLVDVTPRMQASGAERISNFMRGNPEGFASVEEAADAVSAYLPHRPRPDDVSGLERNLRLGTDGRYRWHWDPAMLGSMGVGSTVGRSERLEDAARNVRAPMLLVRGGSSEIVGEEEAAAFRAVVPEAEHVDVAGARHMVAGDRNDAFTVAVTEFLDRHVGADA